MSRLGYLDTVQERWSKVRYDIDDWDYVSVDPLPRNSAHFYDDHLLAHARFHAIVCEQAVRVYSRGEIGRVTHFFQACPRS